MSAKPTKKQGKQQANTNRKLLALAALILLAGALALGYFFLKNNTTLFGSNTQPNQTTQTTTQPNTTQPGGTTTPIADRKFPIPELGITLTLPDGLEGLEYKVTTDEYTKDLSVNITSKDLMKESSCAWGAIGSIKRLSQSPEETLYKNVISRNDWKKVGEHYYLFRGPQSACSEDENTNKLQSSQASLLRKSIQTAVSL